MAKNVADLLVSLGLDAKKFTGGIDKADSRMKKFKGRLKNIAKGAGVAVAAGVAIAAKEATEAENVTMRMIATLKTLDGATVATAEQFKKTASELQKVTTFGDDEIVNGMTDLLLITQDYNDTIKLTATMLDMAAGSGLDLKTSAQLLGRVYKGDTGMLKRYGIVLDEGATSMEALDAISKRFAGQAASRTKTTSGGMKQITNDVSDFGEAVGNYAVGGVRWIKGMIAGEKTLKDFSSTVTEATNESENLAHMWGLAIPSAMQAGIEDMDEAEEAVKELSEAQQHAQDVAVETASVIGSAFPEMVTTILDSTATMTEKMASLMKTGLTAILDVISTQIKAQIALATSQAIATGGLTSAQIAGHAAQLAIVEGLKAAVGTISLAQGGIVSSPTMAMVGDSRISPEVVAPLHKLEPMITRAVNNSSSNKINIVINSNGLDNAADVVRKQIAPELDRYFKKRGGGFYGA